VIDIFIVDEGGNIRATFPDCEALHKLLEIPPPQDGCCLRFIDPYGDSTFNLLQLPVLAGELRAAAAKGAAGLRQRIEALAAFVDSAREAGDVREVRW